MFRTNENIRKTWIYHLWFCKRQCLQLKKITRFCNNSPTLHGKVQTCALGWSRICPHTKREVDPQSFVAISDENSSSWKTLKPLTPFNSMKILALHIKYKTSFFAKLLANQSAVHDKSPLPWRSGDYADEIWVLRLSCVFVMNGDVVSDVTKS